MRTNPSRRFFVYYPGNGTSPKRLAPSKMMFLNRFFSRHTSRQEDRIAQEQGVSTMHKRFISRLSRWRCLVALYVLVAPWIPGAAAQSAEEMMGVKEGHCSVAQGTADGKTFACMVWDHDPARFSDPAQIEVYRGHKRIYTIQPGRPIREWHFWHDGRQLAVHYGPDGELGKCRLTQTRIPCRP